MTNHSHSKPRGYWLAALAALALIPVGPLAYAQTATTGKQLQVRPASSRLEVEMAPTQRAFEVDKPIHFQVRGNSPFYLYVYTVDRDRDEVVLILPNRLQKDNYYPAANSILVPARNVEFYSDRPGTEQVVMVASSQKIPLGTSYLNPAGTFFTGKASDLESDFASKGIHVRPGDTALHTTTEVVVRHLQLQIVAQAAPIPAPISAPPAMVALATDKDDYRIGEQVHILFGANRPGWVHLYTVDPVGNYVLLKSMQVDGRGLYSLAARATAPAGSQALAAVYAPSGALPKATGGAMSKGLALEPQAAPTPQALRQFLVR